ncbi:adhesion G protein-coupled receptor L2-like [Diadema antillarum]|uniref:adhesion G protein-coupled receptor L2-like n=1 Tax=Diadema antillarum TaxID=105358 RepID=UPI003A877548
MLVYGFFPRLLCLATVVCMCSAIVVTSEQKLHCNAGFYKNPQCVDTPAGYWCECGTGFEWNSKLCMTDAVDSRLDFKHIDPPSYAILLGKNVPALEALTVAAWVKLDEERISKKPTLIAYVVGHKEELRINIGRVFRIGVFNKHTEEADWGMRAGSWCHIAVTWDKGGAWKLFRNGTLVADVSGTSPRALPLDGHIESGGDLTIGHMMHHLKDKTRAFLGELSHVHVWNVTLNDSYIHQIATDCTFTYCGNVAEWVDFRSGTRGMVKLRWPSRVFDECVMNKDDDCDSHCSHTIGPQCNQGHDKNILWPRTPTGHNSTRPCPGTTQGFATRTCLQDDLFGEWVEANASACVSHELRDLKNEIEKSVFGPKANILPFLERLYNSTLGKKTNPSDLSASIDCLRLIVRAQASSFDEYHWTDTMLRFKQPKAYPKYGDTDKFVRWFTDTVDNIIDERNDVAWNATLPRGAQAVNLLEVMDEFVDLFAKSFLRHEKRGDISVEEGDGKKAIVRNNIALYLEMVQPKSFTGSFFPDTTIQGMGSIKAEVGQAIIPNTLFDDLDDDLLEKSVAVYYIRYEKIARYLPNHPEQVIVQYVRDKEKEDRHKQDNVNSVVISTGVYSETDIGDVFANLTDPIEINLKFTNSFNISNPDCVYIDISGGPNGWSWEDSDGNISSDGEFVKCLYYRLGTFAVTTDMYDINWDPGEPPRFVVKAAGYIGILIFTTMVAISLGVFFYLRCTTDTVAVHRNLAISLLSLHILFMIGITRQENATVCKIFAIAIHFFFIASFSWICNEAFNLYIEVANSIHADTQQQRPMLRYYVIGWFVPAVLVGALVQSKWETYFAADVCFIDFEHIWLLAGPAAGMWAITVFVLVYTMKDIMESSYSKDKEANKVIGNHCKGCWIQVVLMAVAWAFVLISVDMYSVIPQILFAMFDILQGAFFFVFFCALDGEVTEILAERRSAMPGFNVSPHGIQRSTKYSVYRRYLPPRSSARRSQPPSHIHSPSQHGSAHLSTSERARDSGDLAPQPQERGAGYGGDRGSGGDRSPALVRWGATAVQALRKQHLARKDSEAKREVLARFFSDEEVKVALQTPPRGPEPQDVGMNEDDHLVTSV